MFLKATDPLPERPVVIVIYGDPGMRKTSMVHTANNPILLDFDNGAGRSFGRKDVIVVESWDEVLKYEKDGLYKQYATIGIDTAKAALDDFLMSYVVNLDYKNKINKLAAYGAIGDEFKLFQSNRRIDGADLVIIAHSKKDEDTKKFMPDVTGQSSSLIMRIADQVGFVTTKNGVPTIMWAITDQTIGKNTANLPDVAIPDKESPAWKNFLADIIVSVKKSLLTMSEAQRENLVKSEKYQDEISTVQDVEELNTLLAVIRELPKILRDPLYEVVKQKATASGWIFNADKDKRYFEDPKAGKDPAGDEAPGAQGYADGQSDNNPPPPATAATEPPENAPGDTDPGSHENKADGQQASPPPPFRGKKDIPPKKEKPKAPAPAEMFPGEGKDLTDQQ